MGPPLEDFNWYFNRSAKWKAVFDLVAGGFVRTHRDVLLIGPPGVEKSTGPEFSEVDALRWS